MKHASLPRIVAILLAVIWITAALWATAAQMRESDQASLLTGAVELARGETSVFGNESYNYDKQYLTYWLVAVVLKATGGGGENATIEGVVRVGNYAAALLFSVGLLTLVFVQRQWPWVKLVVLACVLLSPVVAFTGVLLSSNLISGAFILLLVAVLGYGERVSQPAVLGETTGSASGLENPRSIGGRVLSFLLAFAAVAARQDVILLMPLLAILVIPFRTFGGVLKNPTLWALAGGCVLAMVIGCLIDPSPTSLPSPFFVPATFVVYLMGGLGGSLLLVLLFSAQMVRLRTRETLVLGLAILLPLVFYSCLLYTPRHLFVVALALIATVLLPRGAELWLGVASGRVGRVVLGVALVSTLVPWVVGARMAGFTEGRLVISESTFYPTADGFWPMGAYGDFYGRLAKADEVAVDHNQEVWAAWSSVREEDLPSGKGAIVSSGLTSYGGFALMWHGRQWAQRLDEADFVLFDDRTITKQQLGVDRADGPGRDRVAALLSTGRVELVGRANGRSILLWTAEEDAPAVDEAVSLRVALSETAGGNDFRLAPWHSADWKRRDLRGFRIVLAARSTEALEGCFSEGSVSPGASLITSVYDDKPWSVLEVSGEDLARLLKGDSVEGQDIWIACGMLPEFMDVRGYGK